MRKTTRSGVAFTCAYRGEVFRAAPAAHVIPKALGGVTSSRRTVCLNCNHEVNSEVENRALSFFAFYRSVWGIGGRYHTIPPVPGEAMLPDGRTFRVEFGPLGEVRRAIVDATTEPDGRRRYFVLGTAEMVDQSRAEIDRGSRRRIQWESGSLEAPATIRVLLDEDADKLTLRRLATKIAFERAAMLRSGEFLSGRDFDRAREFILQGAESAPICGLIADAGIYAHPSMDFGIGRHAVIVTTQQDVLAAIVVLFNVFFYWVILARPYTVLAQWDDIVIENPQDAKVEAPTIRGGLGAFQFPWNSWIKASTVHSEAVRTAACDLALGRLQRAVDNWYR
jgi:hypothetical protein